VLAPQTAGVQCNIQSLTSWCVVLLCCDVLCCVSSDGDQALALDAQLGVWGGQTVWKSNRQRSGGRYKYRPNFKRQNPQRTSAEDADDFSNTTSELVGRDGMGWLQSCTVALGS
jgi:hypothetical protein